MSSLGLTDKPVLGIEHEKLGMKDYVDAMSEFVRTCQTPMTIAIQGDWGTGKTSMMNMVKEDLSKGKVKVETRWFNTWQYAQFQEQDEIAISLLSGFIDHLDDQAKSLQKAFVNVGKKATGLFGGVAKAVTDMTVGAGGDLMNDLIGKLAQSEQDSARQLRNMKEEIAESVKRVLEKSNSERMVVFIDDLDRIYPSKAVEILETIKLFMDVDRCVFILAVDYHVVSKGLEQKFGISMDDMKGKSFFDKIIQLPFNLPVAQYKIRDYMKSLFANTVQFNEESLGILVRLAEYSIGTNPRSLKRLLNATQLLNIVAGKQGKLSGDAVADKEERQRILFAVLCLQLAYESAYGVILRNVGDVNADYLDSLCDPSRIGDLPDVIDVLRKSMPPGAEQNEYVNRFSSFMMAFKDAIQLKSDGEGVAVVSDVEFDMLRQFLELSSITSTAALSSVSSVSIPASKEMVMEFFSGEFKSRYAGVVESTSSEFTEEYYRDHSYIGIIYSLRHLKFTLWFGWLSNRVVAYIGNSPDTPTKNIFVNYFKEEVQALFPEMEIRNLKSNDYIVLTKKAVVDGDNASSVFEKFKDMTCSVMDRIMTVLVSLHDRKLPYIDRLMALSNDIRKQLFDEFPSESGWIVDGDLTSLFAFKSISIYKEEWEGKFAIQVTPEQTGLNNLYFGLRRVSDVPVMGAAEGDVISLCMKELFLESGAVYQAVGKKDIFYKQFPVELRCFSKGRLLCSDGQLVHESAEDVSRQIDRICEVVARFKRIETKLDEMAKSG